MVRTPLLRSLVRLAIDHRLAWERGVTPEAIRAARAAALDRWRRDGPPPVGLSRRDFLARATGAAVALGALAGLPGSTEAAARGARAARAPRAPRVPRVAIVGGGLAGLTAALTLADARVRSTIYEASDRAGGRVHSNTRNYWRDGQVSEWCGELIDTDHKVVLGLARRFKLPLADLLAAQAPDAEETYYFAGHRYPKAEADRDFQPVYQALRRDIQAAGARTTYASSSPAGVALDNMSVYSWIASRVAGGHASPLGRLLEVAYRIEYGAPTAEQSALNLVYMLGEQPKPGSLSIFGLSDERYRLRDGNGELPRAIAAALPPGTLRLGWRLVALARNPDGSLTLTFDTSHGVATARADHLILALPFAVLRTLDYSHAGFDALKDRAIRELGRGRNVKLHLQFRTRYWSQPGREADTGLSFSDTGYENTWDASRGQSGASGLLVCFMAGDLDHAGGAPYSDAGSDPRVAEQARAILRQLEPVWPGITAQWNGQATRSAAALDPNAACSYSYLRVGQYHAFGGYEGVRQGHIHFAGEHCSPDYQGFMEGAAAQGARAARAVLDDLRGRRTGR
jgi:monoamine oxidase